MTDKILNPQQELLKLQQTVACIIYYYVFAGYYESNYVSAPTDKGIEGGGDYSIYWSKE